MRHSFDFKTLLYFSEHNSHLKEILVKISPQKCLENINLQKKLLVKKSLQERLKEIILY